MKMSLPHHKLEIHKFKPIVELLAVHILALCLRIGYVLFSGLDLHIEEVQYWLWSKHLDWSYYSKPPLIAYLNFLSTSLIGDTVLAIRLIPIVLGFFSSMLIYKFSNDLIKNHKIAFQASLLPYAIPFFYTTSIFHLTDSSLLFFWLAATYIFWKAITLNKGKYWLLLGVVIGLGFLSKYSMLLFVPIMMIGILCYKSSLFKEKWLYVTLIIVLVMLTPVLIWNIQHDFISIKHVFHINYQAENSVSLTTRFGHLFEYTIGQFAFFSIFLIPSLFIQIRKGFTNSIRKDWFIVILAPVFIFVLFLLVSISRKVEANWPIFAYVTIPVFYAVNVRSFKKMRLPYILSLITIVITLVLLFYPHSLSRRMSSRINGWSQLAKSVDSFVNKHQNSKYFVFSDDYHLSSELSFYLPDKPQTYCVNLGRRMNQFDLWPSLTQFENKGFDAVYVTERPIENQIDCGFEKLISETVVDIDNKRSYYLYFLSNYTGINETRLAKY